jgi:hypothetical protein
MTIMTILNSLPGPQKVLTDEGKSDRAAKVQKVFMEIHVGDDIS